MVSSHSSSRATSVATPSGSTASATSTAKTINADGETDTVVENSFASGLGSTSATASASTQNGQVQASADTGVNQAGSADADTQSGDNSSAGEATSPPILFALLGNSEGNVLTYTPLRDIFLGYGGADTFEISTSGASLLEADIIADFQPLEGDQIQLGLGVSLSDITLDEFDFDGDGLLDATAILSNQDNSVLAVVLDSVDEAGKTSLTDASFVIPTAAGTTGAADNHSNNTSSSSSSSSAEAFVDADGAGASSQSTATDSSGNSSSSQASDYVAGGTSSAASAIAEASSEETSTAATVDVEPSVLEGEGADATGSTTASSLSGVAQDSAAGSSEVDILIGTRANDVLVGTENQEIFLGFAGEDYFTLASVGTQEWYNADIIADFEAGIDQLLLSDGMMVREVTVEILVLNETLSVGAIRTVEDNSFIAIVLNAVDREGNLTLSSEDISVETALSPL